MGTDANDRKKAWKIACKKKREGRKTTSRGLNWPPSCIQVMQIIHKFHRNHGSYSVVVPSEKVRWSVIQEVVAGGSRRWSYFEEEDYTPKLRRCACSLFLDMKIGLFGAMNNPLLYRFFRELTENQYCEILFNGIGRMRVSYCAVWNNGNDVLVWGNPENGGDMADFRSCKPTSPVKKVTMNNNGFVATSEDGSVGCWGAETRFLTDKNVKSVITCPLGVVLMLGSTPASWGASPSPRQKSLEYRTIVQGMHTAVGITDQGTLEAFGNTQRDWDYPLPLDHEWDGPVVKVLSDMDAFIGLSTTGRVKTWGKSHTLFFNGPWPKKVLSGVLDIATVMNGFAAIDSSGCVHTTMSNSICDKVRCIPPIIGWLDSFSARTEEDENHIMSWGIHCEWTEERLRDHLAHAAVCVCCL